MKGGAATLLALAICGCASAPAASVSASIGGDPACVTTAADRAWLEAAPAAWRLVERDTLELAPAGISTAFVLYDAACTYGGADGRTWTALVHGGEVRLPDGGVLPPQVASFAAPRPDGTPFMVMALPSIWRADGVTSDMGLEALMFGVFVHEMAHTRQFGVYGPRLEALTARWSLPDDLTDDAVQLAFEGEPDFVASVARERELLYAALEGDAATARARTAEALGLIEARRARWFAGENEKYAELEDVFLTLEGVGNLAGFAWLTHAEGGGLARSGALPAFRRGGRWWSQDEGLAIFLVVERLVPDWTTYAFADEPETALQLLARAAGSD